MINPNIIGQIGFGLSFPVTKGRSDVRGIKASRSLSKKKLNALAPADARNVDKDNMNISNQFSELLGIIKHQLLKSKTITGIINIIYEKKKFYTELNPYCC